MAKQQTKTQSKAMKKDKHSSVIHCRFIQWHVLFTYDAKTQQAAAGEVGSEADTARCSASVLRETPR